jgi:predicted membrane protein
VSLEEGPVEERLAAQDEAVEDRTEVAPASPPPPPPPVHRVLSARLMIGAALVVGGALWLLAALDVFEVSASAVLSGILIAVGVALIAGSRTGRHGGLVALGVILTILLAVGSSLDIDLTGGVGDRSAHPRSLAQLERSYRLGIGQLTLDFTDVAFPPGTYHIEASVGIGQLNVHLPSTMGGIHATAGLGEVDVAGRTDSGFDVAVDVTPASTGVGCSEAACVYLRLSVGIGQVTADGT